MFIPVREGKEVQATDRLTLCATATGRGGGGDSSGEHIANEKPQHELRHIAVIYFILDAVFRVFIFFGDGAKISCLQLSLAIGSVLAYLARKRNYFHRCPTYLPLISQMLQSRDIFQRHCHPHSIVPVISGFLGIT